MGEQVNDHGDDHSQTRAQHEHAEENGHNAGDELLLVAVHSENLLYVSILICWISIFFSSSRVKKASRNAFFVLLTRLSVLFNLLFFSGAKYTTSL